METDPLLEDEETFPTAPWTFQRMDRHGRPMPQAIAHRGYKAQFPENTMGAFRGALEVGAHAIETDIHLSRDGVVVLSHDADLKRCYGREEKIKDCDWAFLSSLKTLKEPRQQMPRLLELLELFAQPENEDPWLLLDIKLDNDVESVMRLIAQTIASVHPHPARPWNKRIVLGCWAAKFLPFCNAYLPGFPITHIGFSVAYARQFLKVPNVSFNMLQKIMMWPSGQRLLHDAHAAGRPVFVWTVNDVAMMRWGIRKGVDGVLTDDPEKFLKVAQDYDETDWKSDRLSWLGLLDIVRVNLYVMVMGSILFRWKYGVKTSERYVRDDIMGIKSGVL